MRAGLEENVFTVHSCVQSCIERDLCECVCVWHWNRTVKTFTIALMHYTIRTHTHTPTESMAKGVNWLFVAQDRSTSESKPMPHDAWVSDFAGCISPSLALSILFSHSLAASILLRNANFAVNIFAVAVFFSFVVRVWKNSFRKIKHRSIHMYQQINRNKCECNN